MPLSGCLRGVARLFPSSLRVRLHEGALEGQAVGRRSHKALNEGLLASTHAQETLHLSHRTMH
jgi:hypothetical protein